MLEQLVEEHHKATSLAEQLSASEPGAERDAALAELDRLLTTHLTTEQQLLATVLGQEFKGPTEFKAPAEVPASPEVVPDALRLALAALVNGGPDTDFAAATSALVQALNEHVHHTEQDLFPRWEAGPADQPQGGGDESDALPPGEVAPNVTPDEVGEVQAEFERGEQ